MYEYLEEIDNQNKVAEGQLDAFTRDLLQLKKVVNIAEKKNALGLVNGVRENLVKLANSYIDSMLNELAEKQTNEKLKKNHEIVVGLLDYMQHPDSPIDPNILIAFANQNKELIAENISEVVKDAGNSSGLLGSIINRLGTKDGIISNKLT